MATRCVRRRRTGESLYSVPAYERLGTETKRRNPHEITIYGTEELAAIQVISASAYPPKGKNFMAKHDNQNQPFSYDRATGEKIPVSKEVRDVYYGEAVRIRMKEQAHGRCVCPQSKVWACDGDYLICEHRRSGDLLLWTFLSVKMARTS